MALVVVDGVEHAGQAALHEGVHLLLADDLGDRSRSHRVGEQDGDRAALPFDGGPRREDLLGQVRRRIRAGVRGRRRRDRLLKPLPARRTEARRWTQLCLAAGTAATEGSPTLLAEAGSRLHRMLTDGALRRARLHSLPPSRNRRHGIQESVRRACGLWKSCVGAQNASPEYRLPVGRQVYRSTGRARRENRRVPLITPDSAPPTLIVVASAYVPAADRPSSEALASASAPQGPKQRRNGTSCACATRRRPEGRPRRWLLRCWGQGDEVLYPQLRRDRDPEGLSADLGAAPWRDCLEAWGPHLGGCPVVGGSWRHLLPPRDNGQLFPPRQPKRPRSVLKRYGPRNRWGIQ